MSNKIEKIKVAFIIDKLGTGGTERQLKLLVEGLDRDKYEPNLFLLRGKKEHPMKPINTPCVILDIHSIVSKHGLQKMWYFSRILHQEEFHIIQTFFQDSAFCGALSGRLANVKSILVSVRDMLFWTKSNSIFPLRFAMCLSHGIVVNSHAVREKILPLSGKKQIKIIPNGIETGELFIKNRDAKNKLAQEFGFNANIPVIITVSNCNRPVKRVDLLVECAALVLKEKRAIFMVVGDGHLRPAFEQRASRIGVSNSVIFAGQRKDVPILLAGSDIYVNTSDSEGLSNSVMEAMRAGLPVVASNVEGNKELINEEENGLLFQPGNANDLALKLLYLIRNHEVNSQMGESAAKVISNKFDLKHMIQKYSLLYSSLVNKTS